MAFQNLNYILTEFTQAGPYESKTGGNMFINKGTTRARVNGFPLEPGEFITLEGNQHEMDRTTYSLNFESIGAVVDRNSLWIWQKNYVA